MLKRLAPVFVTLALLGGLSACGASAVSASDVEKSIVSELKADDGTSPDSADCPKDLDATKGAKMTCTVKAGDQELKVEVEVTSVKDGTANFDITVVE